MAHIWDPLNFYRESNCCLVDRQPSEDDQSLKQSKSKVIQLTKKLRKVASGGQLNPLLPAGKAGTHPNCQYSLVALAGLKKT